MPNAAVDVATFATSGTTGISLSAPTQVSGIVFNPGASAFTITSTPTLTLTISGVGVTNSSGVTQNFVTTTNGAGNHGIISLTNNASAGILTAFTNNSGFFGAAGGGVTQFFNTSSAGSASFTTFGGAVASGGGGTTIFHDTSTAGTATFVTNGATISSAFSGTTYFDDNATAASGTFTANGGTGGGLGGTTQFFKNSTAANGVFTANGTGIGGGGAGTTQFHDTTTAGNGTFTNNGGTLSGANGGLTFFQNSSTAGSGSFTTNGGTVSGANGGQTVFSNSSTAGSGTFITNGAAAGGAAGGGLTRFFNTSSAGTGTLTTNGSTVSGGGGGVTEFFDTSTVGGATLIANGGTGGGNGGTILFFNAASGGTATVKVFGNGSMDIGLHDAPGVTIGSIEGTGKVFLGANNLTVGGNGLGTTFSGVIADGGSAGGTGGSLTKTGAGTLLLTGANTYTGNTTINGGVLALDGSLKSASVLINPGGQLAGVGTAFGNVVNGGLLSPGHSPGTFHIGGSYTQQSGGTLQIEVAGVQPGQFDVLAVGGHASLDGTLRIVRVGGATLKAGDRLAIVTAGGGVSGKFSTVVNPFASGSMLGLGLIYEANDVLLVLTQNSFLQFATLAGLTPNQRAVARTLDRVAFDSREKKLIGFLNNEPLGKVPADFDRIAPEELAAVFNLSAALANVQTANLERRMDDLRAGSNGFSAQGLALGGSAGSYSGGFGVGGPAGKGGKMMEPAADNRWGVFVTGTGEFTKIGDTSNARGYDLNTGGFTLGVDYKLTPSFALGVMSGYARTGIDLNHGGRITVDGGKLGLYATYFTGGFYADAAVSGGLNGYTTRRSALRGDARGSENGGEVDALFATGYDLKMGALTLGPTASFQYGYTSLGSFTESGSLAPLHYGSQHGESLRTALGAKASYDWKIGGVLVRPEVRAAWQHEAGESAYAITSSFANGGGGNFTTHGPSTGRDSLILGGGVAVQWSERLSTYVYYDGEIGRTNLDTHSISGGVRVAF